MLGRYSWMSLTHSLSLRHDAITRPCIPCASRIGAMYLARFSCLRSMTMNMPLSRAKATASSKVGTGSPANCDENFDPASQVLI